MNRKEKVMKRLQEHYNYLADQGHEIIFLAHQGSYNYNLDYEKSDIDSKAVVLPSFKDFVHGKSPFSYTYLGNPINEDNLRYLNDFKYKTLEKFFKKLLQNT